MLDRIPAKGAILGFAVLATSLSLTARLADRGARQVEQLREKMGSPGLPSGEALGQAAGGPGALLTDLGGPDGLPGSLPAELANLDFGAQTAGNQQGDEDAEAEPKRPPGWVYPPFDHSGHSGVGAPHGAFPRNISMRFVGPNGEPVAADTVRGTQKGADGEFSVHAYRSSQDPSSLDAPSWLLGSPALSQGLAATFELEVAVGLAVWTGSFRLSAAPAAIDLDLPWPVQLAPPAPVQAPAQAPAQDPVQGPAQAPAQ